MSAEIAFLWVGKTRAPYARVGVDEYVGRLQRYHPCRTIAVPEERHNSRYSAAHRVDREGRSLLDRLKSLEPAFVVALDPRGRQLTSGELAVLVRRACMEESRRMVFVVGGPDGLSSPIRDRADRLLGLSQMTFPHDMARLFLAEQAYRALTIIHGHPYDR